LVVDYNHVVEPFTNPLAARRRRAVRLSRAAGKYHVTRPSALGQEQLGFLAEAADYLEHPSFLMKAANLVGKPAESIMRALPERAHALVADATQSALERALDWAVHSLSGGRWPILERWQLAHGPRFHMALTAATGAVGGLFGLAGAALEIPATTTLMLRSIAQIAENRGLDLRDPETRLQCLSVFSFGSPDLEAMESAYFSTRFGMALAVRDAAGYIVRHGVGEVGSALSRGAAPALARLISQIAARFQIVIGEKLAAQAVPIAGAAMGSLINVAFTDHFNRVAEFHFGIVQLERQAGREVVQAAYREAVERARQAAR
jgi:hypothetical protein